MATHSGILAWRIPWTEKPGESYGQRSLENPMDREAWRIPWAEKPGESHGQRSLENPMDREAWRIPWAEKPGESHGQRSLENSMDREAWRATAHGVTKSWTWLKPLDTLVIHMTLLQPCSSGMNGTKITQDLVNFSADFRRGGENLRWC